MTTHTKINLMGNTNNVCFCETLAKEMGGVPKDSTKRLSLLLSDNKVILFIVFIIFTGHIPLEYRIILLKDNYKNNILSKLKNSTTAQHTACLFVHSVVVFLLLI